MRNGLSPARLSALSLTGLILIILLTGAKSVQPWELIAQEAVYYRTEGQNLQKIGQLKEASAAYRRAIGVYPQYVEAHNDLGVVLESLGKLKLAEQSYQSALAIRPDFAPAHSNLALFYERQGKMGDAGAHWVARVRLGPPDDPWVIKAKQKLNHYQIPIPKSKEELAEELKHKIQLAMSTARNHMKARRYEAAVAQYELILTWDPGHLKASRALRSAQRKLDKAVIKQQVSVDRAQKRLDAARDEAVDAQAQVTQQEGLVRHRHRGLSPVSTEWTESESTAEASVSLQAEQAAAESILPPRTGASSADAQALARTLAQERSGVRKRTLSDLGSRGQAAMRQGDYKEAMNLYQQILTLDPNNRVATRGFQRAEKALAKETKSAQSKR